MKRVVLLTFLLRYIRKSDMLARRFYHCPECHRDSSITGSVFYEMKKFDSALAYLKSADSKGAGWDILMPGRTHAKLNKLKN